VARIPGRSDNRIRTTAAMQPALSPSYGFSSKSGWPCDLMIWHGGLSVKPDTAGKPKTAKVSVCAAINNGFTCLPNGADKGCRNGVGLVTWPRDVDRAFGQASGRLGTVDSVA